MKRKFNGGLTILSVISLLRGLQVNYRDVHRPILRVFFLALLIAGCGTTPDTVGPAQGAKGPGVKTTKIESAADKYEHVGTYEHFATPMGSSVSVLMVDERKIKITDVDETRYVNIPMNKGMPVMQISGTYGINGEFENSTTTSSEVFIVREIEYLGGGGTVGDAGKRTTLPDFFVVDGSARGPLSLSELQIRFPDSLARYFNEDERECFYRQVEARAADMGDPLTMEPIKRVLLTNSQKRWDQMTDEDKRLQLARYVTSMALHGC